MYLPQCEKFPVILPKLASKGKKLAPYFSTFQRVWNWPEPPSLWKISRLSQKSNYIYRIIIQITCIPEGLNTFDDLNMPVCSMESDTNQNLYLMFDSIPRKGCKCLDPCSVDMHRFKVYPNNTFVNFIND